MVGIQNVFDFLSGDFLALSLYDGVGKTVNLLVTQEKKVTRYSAASIFFSLLGLRFLKFDFGRFESIHNGRFGFIWVKIRADIGDAVYNHVGNLAGANTDFRAV